MICDIHNIPMRVVCDEFTCWMCQDEEPINKKDPPTPTEYWISHDGLWHDKVSEPVGDQVNLLSRENYE